jgi:hypothetical protein
LLVVVWLLLMPAAHGFSFPEDWENIRRSMLTRKREQELQVRRKQREKHGIHQERELQKWKRSKGQSDELKRSSK